MRVGRALWLAAMCAGVAHSCVHYGEAVDLVGRLAEVDEAGYNRYVEIHFPHPICIAADPAHQLEGFSGVTRMQVMAFGEGSKERATKIGRLIGMRVRIRGEVILGDTGYYRTGLALIPEQVTPLDPEGEKALQTRRALPVLRNPATYDLHVTAGPRLRIEARETATGWVLTPGDRYASHWMTGGEVVYLKCMDGYEMKVLQITPDQATWCDTEISELGCILNAFSHDMITLHLRCNRRSN